MNNRSNPEKDFVIINDDSKFKGVSYRINNTEFVEEDGKHLLKFDYDVKGLREGDEIEFEQFLGEFIIRALKWAIEEDEKKDNTTI